LSEDSLSLSEDSAIFGGAAFVGVAFAGAALAAFDGAASSSDESESESSGEDEEAFLVGTTFEGFFAVVGATFSSDESDSSEESESSEEPESAFLGASGVRFGEGLVVAAAFGAGLATGFGSSSLSLESDEFEGGLAAFTCVALGFSSSEELSLLSSEGDGSLTFLAWKGH